jgi:hypothetical protein
LLEGVPSDLRSHQENVPRIPMNGNTYRDFNDSCKSFFVQIRTNWHQFSFSSQMCRSRRIEDYSFSLLQNDSIIFYTPCSEAVQDLKHFDGPPHSMQVEQRFRLPEAVWCLNYNQKTRNCSKKIIGAVDNPNFG